jgi:uracil-DNA glycosylase
MSTEAFLAELTSYHSERVFNPYSDVCSDHDLSDAPTKRSSNLRNLLTASVASDVDTIWVARDLGYRGGRRTGVPLTDEVHLSAVEDLFNTEKICKATTGDAVAERTASVIWGVLRDIQRPVMLWNVFPFHPHEDENPMSNRCHTSKERDQTLPYLWDLVELLRPKQLVAIGRDAQEALCESPIPVINVRHPSYGGQREFTNTLLEFYNVEPQLSFGDATRQMLS